MITQRQFTVGLTADFYDEQGKLKYVDIGLNLLDDAPNISVTRIAKHAPEIRADQITGMNGVIVLTPSVTAATLQDAQDLLVIGRFGVGYDGVDVAACTNADVVLFITAGAVDYSVAEATVAWMLSLSHHVRTKDHLVRSGQWDARSRWMGSELRDRTLGIIGFGGIGRAVQRMTEGFGMLPPLVFDPYVSAAAVTAAGARPATLDELLAQSDFVSLHCPLNEKTRNLLTARELGLMQPTAFLINTARGGIVNENDLYDALVENRIAGAAIDCFVQEPLVAPTPLTSLENVLLAPHSIAWTNELFRDIGRSACQGMIDLAQRRTPHGVVNPDVLKRRGFQEKWERLTLGP